MSKTNQDKLYNEQRRRQRLKNRKVDHTKELVEKRTKNALRSNNVKDLIGFSDYFE